MKFIYEKVLNYILHLFHRYRGYFQLNDFVSFKEMDLSILVMEYTALHSF